MGWRQRLLNLAECLWAILALSCHEVEPGIDLLIDLKTDLVGGIEFVRVRAEHFEHLPSADEVAHAGQVREVPVEPGQQYIDARRAAQFSTLTPGTHAVRLRLIGPNNEIVLQRVALITLRRTAVFTILMTRDCRGVECPGAANDPSLIACVASRCVDPRCTLETPEFCPTFDCGSGSQCVATTACAVARCSIEGVCLQVADSSRCPTGEWCSPDEGCIPGSPLGTFDGGLGSDAGQLSLDGSSSDAGSSDAGSSDAGSSDAGSSDAGSSDAGSSDAGSIGAGSTFDWSSTFGSSGTDEAWEIAIANGGLYIGGLFESSVDFGGGLLTSVGGEDAFIARLDASGTHVWSRAIGSTGNDRILGLVEDGASSYVAGWIAKPATCGAIAIPHSGGRDGFLASYDALGTCRWAVGIGGAGADQINSIAVDSLGNVYVGGVFSDTVDLGGGPLSSAGVEDAFLASYDAQTGAYQWAVRIGGTGEDRGGNVATDAAGRVYIVGHFSNTIDLGTGPISSNGSLDVFVASYSSSGDIQWVRSFGSSGLDRGLGIATTEDGATTYVTGFVGGSTDFGGGSVPASGGLDTFVASYDSTGGFLNQRRLDNSSDDKGQHLAVDPAGNALIGGHFMGAMDFGSGNQISNGGDDAFVASYDPMMNLRWVRTYGRGGTDITRAVCAGRDGTVGVVGHFEGTVDFGSGAVTSQGLSDTFLVVLSPP